MHLTAFAYLYIPILVASLWFGRIGLTVLLIVSAALQATSVINIPVDGRAFGISPYNLTAFISTIWLVFDVLRGRRIVNFGSLWVLRLPLVLLVGYTLVALLSAWLLPKLFAGMNVYLLIDPDPMANAPRALSWTVSNAAQSVNLCVHLLVLVFVMLAKSNSKRIQDRVFAGAMIGLIVVLSAGFWERISIQLAWGSATSFWVNNLGYSNAGLDLTPDVGFTRIGTPFSEPSYASVYFAATTIGLLTVAAFGLRWRLALGAASLSGLGLVNTFGFTGWASAGVALTVLALWLGVNGLTSNQTGLKSRAVLVWSGMAAFSLMALWLMIASPWAARAQLAFNALIWNKLNFDANDVRHQSNLMALRILWDTSGLGVGLGSNRSSSFFFSLLSNTGVVGAGLFCGILVSLFLRYWQAPFLSDIQIYSAAALATATLGVGLGIPDLNLPMYWGFIFLAFACCPDNGKEIETRVAVRTFA